MKQVNMLEAKSTLSKLVDEIEQGKRKEVVIARHGRPAAKLVAIDTVSTDKRLGVAEGKFRVPENIDAHNAWVAHLFVGSDAS